MGSAVTGTPSAQKISSSESFSSDTAMNLSCLFQVLLVLVCVGNVVNGASNCDEALEESSACQERWFSFIQKIWTESKISFYTKNLDWIKYLFEGQWQLMMPIMWNQVLNLERIGWTWKPGGTAGGDTLVFICVCFLAALAALYLPLYLSDCHFRIWTQRVTFKT